MRQIKAFVRSVAVDNVVKALEAAGVPGVTVSTVHGVGYGYEPEHFTLAPRDVAHAPQIAKVEVVCRAPGRRSVAPVERAVKVRTGEEGPQALSTLGRQE